MSQYQVTPAFIPGDKGALYTCLYQPVTTNVHSECFVIVPALAEEMNRCRYMCTLFAQAVAELGYGCLLIDPYGTGDSEGQFGEMEWQSFSQDIVTATEYAVSSGYDNISLLGIRHGALHALDVSTQIKSLKRILFWQPVTNGKMALTQFLRIRIAASLSRNEEAESVADFENMAANDQAVEVAGYDLSPSYFYSLQNAKLDHHFEINHLPIGWFTSIASAERKPPRAEQNIKAKWQEAGASIDYFTIVAPPYWQVHERTLAPQLVDETIAYIKGVDANE